jgi:ketosteroid isomerase-like protein
LKLEEVWNAAHLKGDAEALERLWDADLVVMVPKMAPISRASALALTRSGRFPFQKYETSGVTARVYGDTAIVQGRLLRSRRLNDEPVEESWLFTKVYLRRGPQWKVVAFHASDAPK